MYNENTVIFSMLSLDTSIGTYCHLAKVSEKNLAKLGIHTVRDLIFYFPFRYEDLSDRLMIGALKIGQTATIKGRLDLIVTKRSPRKRMYITEALVSDETGTIKVVWFNQAFIGKALHVGDMIFFSGQVTGEYIGMQMTNPSYEKMTSSRTEGSTLHTGRIVPIYPTTQGVTSRQLRLIMKKCLIYTYEFEEWLPADIIKKYGLLSYVDALTQIHFPKNGKMRDEALRRLKFDELFVIQLYTQQLRILLNNTPCHTVTFNEEKTKSFVAGLNFRLTDAQRKSAWEILLDIGRSQKPMNRLLEGDVGSGKTVVAALVMLNVFYSNLQSVLLAPTEILARQHFDSLISFFSMSGMRIGLYTRNTLLYHDTSCEQSIFLKKKELLDKMARREIDCCVGTHSLLQESVAFNTLGLIIVDEQHRFGVKQRQFIKERVAARDGIMPHFLSMTATPIPRSLALALYGDLDISIINQLPNDRKKVITELFSESKRQEAYTFIRNQINEGRQCFIVCPLINQSDKLGVTSVEQEFEKLDKDIFKDLLVGRLHGKLKKDEKAEIMERFFNNEIQILISTSVIEVGVNVPNATVMVIEGADRFGLAQLHQFRGRVGRSSYQSYCFLMADSQLSDDARVRLEYFTKISDGFELAEYDLRTRGPGDVYGYRQSGSSSLKLASIADHGIIKIAREGAIETLINLTIDDLSLDLKKRLQEFTDLVNLE